MSNYEIAPLNEIQKKSIGVFCGASDTVEQRWLEIATALGRLIAQQGLVLVYGGGNLGLMGRVADSCLDCGGEVIGVITEKLKRIEVAHDGLDSLQVTSSMSERRNHMIERSDMFVVLPGGVGTLDEFFEVLALNDLQYHSKKIGLLNAFGYYDHMLAFFEEARKERFISDDCMDSMVVESEPESLLSRLVNG